MDAIRKQIIKACHDFKIDTVYWDKRTLEPHENCLRNYPAPWIKKTIELLKIMGAKTMIEIGSTREELLHNCISYYDNSYSVKQSTAPNCCQDGHSTYFWAKSGIEIYTVDIDLLCLERLKSQYANRIKEPIPDNLKIHIPYDGIQFLKKFDKQIDFLFLDGWDVGTGQFAEYHLAAFLAAQNKLAPLHLISVDDTDYKMEEGGKDRFLSPFLIENGYIKILSGRQTVFMNL